MRLHVTIQTPDDTAVDMFDALAARQPRDGVLTTDHAASSYGSPVLVVDGTAMGPADLPVGTRLRSTCVMGGRVSDPALREQVARNPEAYPDLRAEIAERDAYYDLIAAARACGYDVYED